MTLIVIYAVADIRRISFLLWSNTLLYEHIAMCFIIFLLKDIGVLPGLGLLRIKLL